MLCACLSQSGVDVFFHFETRRSFKNTYWPSCEACPCSALLIAFQNAVEDDDEMFIEPPEDLDLGAQMRRKAELIRIREAQEAALMDQSFSFCWNSTLGFKMRNSTVLNLHRYALAHLGVPI